MEGLQEVETKTGYELNVTDTIKASQMNFGSLDIVWKTMLKVKVYKLGYQTII